MNALQCCHLFFICFLRESSTIFRADFHEILWTNNVDEILTTYGGSKPKRLERKSVKTTFIKEKNDVLLSQNFTF